MGLRARTYGVLVVWYALAIGAFAVTASGGPSWPPLLLFPLVIVLGIYLNTLRCPKCETSIFYRNWTLFGTWFPVWMGWPAHRCSVCGHEIT